MYLTLSNCSYVLESLFSLFFLSIPKFPLNICPPSTNKDYIFQPPLQLGGGGVQSLSHAWLFVTPWTAARQASLSFTISQSLLKLMSTELVMSSNHLILCHSLLLLPSIFQAFLWSNSDRCTRCELIKCKQKHSTTASWKAPWKTACVRGSFASSSSPMSSSCCLRCACNGWNSNNHYGLWVDLESLGVDLENENHVRKVQQQERMLGSCPVESHSTLALLLHFFSNIEKEINVYLNCSCSVAKLCPTLCDPMDCSMPGFSVLHYLPEFAQTDVHQVSDAM